MLEKTLESPLDSKKLQPVNPKQNHSWLFIGSIDDEAETPTLWPPDTKNWVTGKNPDAQKDWRWEKGMTEGEMVGRHYQGDGHEFEYVLGVGDGQGSLVYCSSWAGRVRHGWATKLNWICRYKHVCIFAWVTIEDFPGSSEGKESASNAEDPDLIPWLERSPGEGNGNPLQYSCLENFMDRGAWQCTVPGVTKSVTWLSD